MDTNLTKITFHEIPETVSGGRKGIDKYAFKNVTTLTSIEFTRDLNTIRDGAFEGSGLTSVVVPETVVSLGKDVFKNCLSLTTVDFRCTGYVLGILATSTFEGCTALTSVTLADGLVTIGENTFKGCTALMNIDIPASVVNMYPAFEGWTAEQTITLLGRSTVPEATSSYWKEGWNGNATVVCELAAAQVA